MACQGEGEVEIFVDEVEMKMVEGWRNLRVEGKGRKEKEKGKRKRNWNKGRYFSWKRI